jgi:hypothetical protein
VSFSYANMQWVDHNEGRRYPFTVESTLADVTDTLVIPNEFIVGLYLSVHYGLNVDPAKFFLSSLGNFATGFGIVVSYNADSGPVPVATANISRAAYSPGQSYRLTGLGDFLDATGVIQLGSLDNIDQQPSGLFSFAFEAARLETDAVRPMIRGISSLRIQSGASLSDRLYGDIVLVAGENMRLTIVQEEDEDPQIVFDAIEGEGLNENCVCEDDPTQFPPIRTINGIPPTANGEFTLLGSSCLEVTELTNGLQLVDTCSEPCCGCTELETITAQLEQFNRQATTLENFLNSLESRVTTMDSVVLGSRIGDRSCITCE